MECRKGCGACCIAPSITQPYHLMPEGKRAGERCVHLDDDHLCRLFGDHRRPACCNGFQAEELFCGRDFVEGIAILSALEAETKSR